MIREQGFALITVLLFSMVFFALGVAALTMSYFGFHTQNSENNYQRAGWAAEYAINQAVSALPTCSSTETSCPVLSLSGLSCRYAGIPDSGNAYCLIRGVGQFRNASIVKMVVMPIAPTGNWSAMVARSGTLNLSGSSSIANCDTTCPAGGPAVLYQAALNGSYTPVDSTPANCPNNPTGVYGHPAVQQKSTLPNDLASTFFGGATDWAALLSALGSKYGADASGLGAGSIPAACQVSWVSPCGGKKQPACKTIPPSGCTGGRVYVNAPNQTVTLSTALSNLTLVSNGTVALNTEVSGVNIFAENISVSTDGEILQGGAFFSRSATSIALGSNQVLGTSSSPVLMIQGGNLSMSGSGGPDLFGMTYTRGSSVSISGNGNVKVHGTMIHDNANGTFDTSSGNLALTFDYTVLANLSVNLSGLTRSPSCGGTTKDYLLTKQTAF